VIVWWRSGLEPEMVHPKGSPCRLRESEVESQYPRRDGLQARLSTSSEGSAIQLSWLASAATLFAKRQTQSKRLRAGLLLPISNSRLSSMPPSKRALHYLASALAYG
jgi:hypothetical protein